MIRLTTTALVIILLIAIATLSTLSGCSSLVANNAPDGTPNNFTNGGISDVE